MKYINKTTALGATAIVALTALSAAHLRVDLPASAHQQRVERGAYLVKVIGCEHCHMPKKMGPDGPVPDESRHLSGHPEDAPMGIAPALPEGPWAMVGSWDLTAWSGPWGTSYGINLTPDENTGIGSWSQGTFVQAMRTGRHMGVSRPILPPMPWENFRHLTDEDLSSIYAFLMSQPPIQNRVPEPLPPITSTVVAGS